MNRFFFRAAVAVLAVSIVAGCSKDTGLKTAPPEFQMYNVENISIEFEYGGSAKGTKKQVIGNYGMYQRDEDDFVVTIGGQSRPIRQLVLKNDSVQYTVDVDKKEAVSSMSQLVQLRDMIKDFTPEQRKNVNAELMKTMGATKTGTETVADRECDVYDLNGMMTVALWKGIPLRTEMVMGGEKLTLKAVKVDESPALDISMFTPAKDIKVVEQAAGDLPPGHPPVDGSGQ